MCWEQCSELACRCIRTFYLLYEAYSIKWYIQTRCSSLCGQVLRNNNNNIRWFNEQHHIRNFLRILMLRDIIDGQTADWQDNLVDFRSCSSNMVYLIQRTPSWSFSWLNCFFKLKVWFLILDDATLNNVLLFWNFKSKEWSALYVLPRSSFENDLNMK